jgi:hypothetical protein
VRPAAIGAAAVALALLSISVAEAEVRRYAVVVAHGEDLSGKSAPLQYADDDGARYYELFSHVADEVTLYAVLDAASQRLYPQAAAVARVPRHGDVLAGLDRVFARARADIERGDEVVFYFVLVGHGEIGAGGEGYVSLLDAPFTRSDLYHQVLARSPATTNHVIVDACNSYFMVHRRGANADDGGPSRADAVSAFLGAEELRRYPNTGVLLSTSSQRDSHEWSAYGAGVFSHQLRSALLGAADVNGDGRIEYSEIEAFVAAANLRVDDPRARIEIFARPPAVDLSRPVVDLTQSRFQHFLRVPAGAAMRVYLQDARGVRYLDAHTSGERPLLVALAPSDFYYLRAHDGTRELRVALDRPGRVDVALGRMAPAAIASRGAVAESFRLNLYAEPYGPSFYRGYVANRSGHQVKGGAAWLPPAAIIDAARVDAELRALEALAARDPALRQRLRAAAPAVLRALADEDFEKAAGLLGQAAGD